MAKVLFDAIALVVFSILLAVLAPIVLDTYCFQHRKMKPRAANRQLNNPNATWVKAECPAQSNIIYIDFTYSGSPVVSTRRSSTKSQSSSPNSFSASSSADGIHNVDLESSVTESATHSLGQKVSALQNCCKGVMDTDSEAETVSPDDFQNLTQVVYNSIKTNGREVSTITVVSH